MSLTNLNNNVNNNYVIAQHEPNLSQQFKVLYFEVYNLLVQTVWHLYRTDGEIHHFIILFCTCREIGYKIHSMEKQGYVRCPFPDDRKGRYNNLSFYVTGMLP